MKLMIILSKQYWYQKRKDIIENDIKVNVDFVDIFFSILLYIIFKKQFCC